MAIWSWADRNRCACLADLKRFIGIVNLRQVTVSRRIKLAGDADLVAESEAEDVQRPDMDALAAMTSKALRLADRAGLLPELLNTAEAKASNPVAAWDAVAGLLAMLPVGEWWMLPPPEPPPSPPPSSR